MNFKESIVIADMLWQWILNEIVSLQQKSSLWNTQGAFWRPFQVLCKLKKTDIRFY